ncbi:MAG TPA: carbohydrate binding domain-containing protein, partial [Polyangia bacterium]
YVVGQQALPSASQIIRRIQPPRGTSERAAMFSTDPIEDGADLFIDLRPLIGSAQHVDLSRYTGIAFWSRMVGGPANPNRNLIVAIKDDRYPVNDEEFWVGQTMTTPWFSAWAAARPSWQRQEIRFSEFAQRLGLTADSTIAGPTLRTNAIASIHFTTLARVPFELWIDDLVLTCAGPCPGEETPIPPVCTPGADQTCNDNPAISSLHGMCTPAGICVCQPAYAKNPATGKCL